MGQTVTVTDEQRRRRLARRHGLAPSSRLADTATVTRAMTVLHATEPSTVHLSVRARSEQVGIDEVERALYSERSVVKQLAMRRTLFVFPRDLLPAAWGSASARVAEQERRKIAASVVGAGLTDDGEAWLDQARSQVLHLLADADAVPAARVRSEIPMLAGKVATSANTTWGGPTPIAPRVLTWLGARGEIVRGANAGHWRISRPAWTRMETWLGQSPDPFDQASGYAELTRRWLGTFGPGTESDLVWWLGATKTAVRQALTEVGAVAVELESGETGWLLPGDLESLGEDTAEAEPWAALLPTLDPTTMGWRGRDFYLAPSHVPRLFDTNGNAGNTAWVDGRVVGAWVQDDDAVVRPVPLESLETRQVRLLEAEATRLTEWLDGVRIANVYQSQVMRGLPLR